MATRQDFPHLHLTFSGIYDPHFQGGSRKDPDVDAIRANPKAHAERIRSILGEMRLHDDQLRSLRLEGGLAAIPADKGFLLRLPEGVDVEKLVRALGVELVAETEEGLMLVSSADLQLTKLEEVLTKFESGLRGGGAASSLLDVYEHSDDPRRLQSILDSEILAIWPLKDAETYIFDIGIQTATSTRDIVWPPARKKESETLEMFHQRRELLRNKAWQQASDEWDNSALRRVQELDEFIKHYGGEIISEMISDFAQSQDSGMVFPDSVQIRVRMNGAGFRDTILNFAHLLEVALPPEVATLGGQVRGENITSQIVVHPPADDAPTVCVIDSGIQENHPWLRPAIDSAASHCFLPGAQSGDVADYVRPQGHGTRVAGAILYPDVIPVEGDVTPIAWLQNARVLDKRNLLPERLPPEEYLHEVVAHFHVEPRFTRIYNHSINAIVPCPKQRMTSWAAKLDELSHEYEVLFIQSAGNQNRFGKGDQSNPGLQAHLEAGRLPPEHQLEPSMRIANPGQSLHALTVGSVSPGLFEDADERSFAIGGHQPSGFSRSGFGHPWSVVKPEVVEVGGDLVFAKNSPQIVREHPDVAIELLNSTMYGAPVYSKDGAGTSFATPKVTHIAAHLQSLFPTASPLLYRALIVQSARWPAWADQEPVKEKVLRLIGYGVPSLERATTNDKTRVTLVTPNAELMPSKRLHLYTIRIPEEIRNAALEATIRVDVTLAYTALPRRTRGRRTGYLETWLDWESSKLGEPRATFLDRMKKGGRSPYIEIPWTLHKRDDWGEAKETSRNRGTVQKDWATFNSFDLPEEFAIAVRSHIGWNHMPEAGTARYCLVVSFEAMNSEVPIYSLIESLIQVEAETEIEVRT